MGGRKGQHAELCLPRFAQAGPTRLQVRVVVAGMADKFPCALRNATSYSEEESLVKCAGDHNPQGSVRREEAFAIHGLPKLGSESAQNLNFNVARPQTWPRHEAAGSERQ